MSPAIRRDLSRALLASVHDRFREMGWECVREPVPATLLERLAAFVRGVDPWGPSNALWIDPTGTVLACGWFQGWSIRGAAVSRTASGRLRETRSAPRSLPSPHDEMEPTDAPPYLPDTLDLQAVGDPSRGLEVVRGHVGAETFDVIEIHQAWRAKQPDLEVLRGQEEAVLADLRGRRPWGARWVPAIMPWVWLTVCLGVMWWDLSAGVGLLAGIVIATRWPASLVVQLGLSVVFAAAVNVLPPGGSAAAGVGVVAGVALKILYRLGLPVYVTRLWKRRSPQTRARLR